MGCFYGLLFTFICYLFALMNHLGVISLVALFKSETAHLRVFFHVLVRPTYWFIIAPRTAKN